jgi:hypothetical protein
MGPRLIGASHPSLWTDKAFVTAMLENLFDVAVEDYYYHAYAYTTPWTDCFDFDGFLEKLQNSPFINDKEVMLEAWKLEYADAVETECEFGLKDLIPESLRKDPEFILEAIKWSSASALAFADKSLLSNKEVVMAAVQLDGKSLSSVDETLKADREVVLAAVESVGWALRFADEALKADKEIALTAIQQDARALDEVGDSLKNNPEFMKEVEQYL